LVKGIFNLLEGFQGGTHLFFGWIIGSLGIGGFGKKEVLPHFGKTFNYGYSFN